MVRAAAEGAAPAQVAARRTGPAAATPTTPLPDATRADAHLFQIGIATPHERRPSVADAGSPTAGARKPHVATAWSSQPPDSTSDPVCRKEKNYLTDVLDRNKSRNLFLSRRPAMTIPSSHWSA